MKRSREIELVRLPHCQLTRIGGIWAAETPIEVWAADGRRLEDVHEGLRWIIGDWALFGENQYGQRYKMVCDAVDRSYGTVANCVRVCRVFEFSRRRENLFFKHHEEVAALEPRMQDHYLRIAEKRELSALDLRQLIRQDQADVDDQAGPKAMPSPNHWTNRLALWLGQQRPETWPRERMEMARDELAPIVAFHGRLQYLLRAK